MLSGTLSTVVSHLRPRKWRPAALPMAIPLTFLLIGVVPVALWEIEGISAWLGLFIALFGVAAGFWAFAVHWRNAVLWVAFGVGLAGVHINRPWNSYRPLISSEGSFVHAEIVLTDSSLVGAEDLEWLNPAGRVWAVVTRMRVSRDEPWTRCGGRLQVSLEDTHGLRYGDRLIVAGALRNPMAQTMPYGFDQRHYLGLKGIEHSLHVIDRRRQGVSLWHRPVRLLLEGRAHALRGLLRGVGDENRRGILAGIVFGMKNGVDHACKRRFLLSGMIHLLAVSGLHVGILATIVLFALAIMRVPYRVRYALLPLFLLLFVIMSGAGVSAVRAWLMIAIWATGKSMLRASIPLNAVFAAAFILLVLNPLSFMTIGFQFSFLLVTAILLGWRLLGMLWGCLGMRSTLVPGRAQRDFRRGMACRKALFMTVGSMILFWLAGLGLSVWCNHFINPAGILGNVCVTAIAWGLMALSWLKIPLEILHVPLVTDGLAWALSALIGLLEGVSTAVAAEYSVIGIGVLPRWWFSCYYASILLLVLSPARVGAVLCRVSLPVMLVVMAIAARPEPLACVDVFAVSGTNVPVVCIRDGERCTMINVGTRGFDRFLGPWLEGHGIRRVDRILFLDGRVRHTGCLAGLSERFAVNRVDVLAGRKPRRSWIASLVDRGTDVRFGHQRGTVETTEESGRTIVTVRTVCGDPVRLIFPDMEGDTPVLTVDTGNVMTIPLWYHRDNQWITSITVE